jgi:hypothetical protein
VDSSERMDRVPDTFPVMTQRSGAVAVTDPTGRSVVLSKERWGHITTRHPELRTFRAEILEAVRRPTIRVRGKRPGEEWFYLLGVGPSRSLKVVVAYEGAVGQIRTAFARRAVP